MIPHYIYAGLPVSEREKIIAPFPVCNELKKILSQVCMCTNTSMEQVLGKNRHRDIVDIRQVYCYLSRMRTGCSFREIGALVGQGHCSALYAVNRITDLLQMRDRKIVEIMKKIKIVNNSVST
jgi:chromosomal replication initiation ATPase DnaA